jgi:hypothetical protein
MRSHAAARLCAAAFLTLTACGALALASAAALAGCAGPSASAGAQVDPEWRLVPEGTALEKRRQFFLYGRHLDSAKVSGPPSVAIEPGPLNPGGRVLALYLTVKPLAKDSLAKGEATGSRELQVKTPDTALTFKLKVVDEALPR